MNRMELYCNAKEHVALASKVICAYTSSVSGSAYMTKMNLTRQYDSKAQQISKSKQKYPVRLQKKIMTHSKMNIDHFT